MKEMIIRVPDDYVSFVEEFIERIGGDLGEKKERKVAKSKESKQISPTYLFGKWKNVHIDAKKLREEAWGRS
ncbi:hypothetical protein [Foetidibacter luteolus]|uniref:hypothetical protein n=1 Tax=Foetidibacter luteolus TaxID=2608880 RepID=UPI00129A7289|nr:hypothetical protein [Foetidibacter luteolus]